MSKTKINLKSYTSVHPTPTLIDYDLKDTNQINQKIDSDIQIYESENEILINANPTVKIDQRPKLAAIQSIQEGYKIVPDAENDMWLIVRSIGGYILKPGDVFRLGQHTLRIRNISGGEINRYKAQPEYASSIATAYLNPPVPPFLSKKAVSFTTSAAQSQCRICLCDEASNTNPLISPCNCTGSLEHVHLQCLQQWLKQKVPHRIRNQSVVYDWSDPTCEICTYKYPETIKLGSVSHSLIDLVIPDSEYIIMEKIEDRGKRLVYILPLKQGLVTLGRGRLCDIYFKDNTISRFHATITKTSKGFILKDLRSKFGTLVRVTRPIILDRSIHFQIRRNILAFDLIKSSKFWCCFGIRNEEEPPKITQVTGVNDRTSLQTQQNVYNLLSIVIKMESSWIVRHELTMGEQGIDVFGVRWNAEDSHIAAACSDGTVKIYNLLSGNLVRSLNCRQTIERMPVTAIRWRPMESQGKTKNVILVTTADGAILHWHGTSGKILHTTTFQENQALCCDYTLDATAYSVGCKDFSVQIYDEETKQQRQIMHAPRGEKRSHGNRVFAVKFYTNDILLSGGWDNSVIVWDVRSNDIIRTVLGPHLCADAMDTKEDQLLTGSYLVENQLQIWNLNEGYNIHTETILTESERPVMLYAAQYSKSDGGNFYVAGGAGGDEAHFYHSDTNTKFAVLTNLPNAVYGVDWANSDSRVAIGCGDGGVRIFRVIHSST